MCDTEVSSHFPRRGMNEDPIAKRLRDAQARSTDERDAAQGKRELEIEFAANARQRGRTEFERLRGVFEHRINTINASSPPILFRYVNSTPPAVAAGKYALTFEGVERLDEYLVEARVGLRLDIDQPIVEVPDFQTTHFRASLDEGGFFWDDNKGGQLTPDQIVEAGLEALTKVLEDEPSV